ncbi:hypothetical protein GQ457_01G054850 [Hibiscus cannabinus]
MASDFGDNLIPLQSRLFIRIFSYQHAWQGSSTRQSLNLTNLPLRNSKMFTNKKINAVLDEMNFLLRKQQVLLTIRSHRLETLLTGILKFPPEMLFGEDGTQVVNEDFDIFVA